MAKWMDEKWGDESDVRHSRNKWLDTAWSEDRLSDIEVHEGEKGWVVFAQSARGGKNILLRAYKSKGAAVRYAAKIADRDGLDYIVDD
jgi:hypothetical protein